MLRIRRVVDDDTVITGFPASLKEFEVAVKKSDDISAIDVPWISVPGLFDSTVDPYTGLRPETIPTLRQGGEEFFEGEMLELIGIHGHLRCFGSWLMMVGFPTHAAWRVGSRRGWGRAGRYVCHTGSRPRRLCGGDASSRVVAVSRQ